MAAAPAATSTSTPSSAVERAVVSKGRASHDKSSSSRPPLIFLHAPSTSVTKAQVFGRHAHFLYHHLLGKLRASARYRGVVVVGLEDVPEIMHHQEAASGGEGKVVALDGFTTTHFLEGATSTLDLTSPKKFVTSIQKTLGPLSSAPATMSDKRRRHEGEDDDDDEEEEEEEEDQEEDESSMALGIDSVNMLAHRLGGMQPTMQAFRTLRSRSLPPLSPVLSVLHPEGGSSRAGRRSLLSTTWRRSLEDLATTNVYIHPVDQTTGRCFVVRKSASGKVHEEWDAYVVEATGQVRFTTLGALGAATVKKQQDAASSRAAGGENGSKKEVAFLESLPFRLSLSEQERAMRGQTVLPHERQRTLTGVGLDSSSSEQPLIYHEDEDFDEEEEFEEEEEEEDDFDEDADDDLDL